jgi:glycosyltransferase involved in cell wall biosynthesis
MEFAPAPTLNSDIVAGVRGCTGVIAATEGVAEAYRPYAPWVEVIPNRMPEEISRYAAGSQRRRRTIAYLAILDPMGTQGVAPHYLDAMLVTDAIGRRPVHVIGGSDGSGEVFRNVTYTGRPLLSEVRYPRRETGALYHALAGFRVAIAPLLDTKWNRAKSWIKPLEAATVGVPCVASRTPEYVRLYNADVPVWLAETDDEWQTYLDFFLGMGETEWRTLSESLRLAAREQSIERHSEWSDLLDRL